MVFHRPAPPGGLIRPVGLRNKKDPFHLLPMLFGFLMGSVVMGVFMVPLDDVRSKRPSVGDSVPVDSMVFNEKETSPPGWHPIHVFFGYEDGLQINQNQEWFSQVHQDEVVLDLVGRGGYFIDLAANDAKEFSNTLALEKHGWNGLCVEPNPTYWYGLSHRKCTVVAALVGGPQVTKVNVKFRGVFGGILGKMDEKLANRKKEPDALVEQRYTAPLEEVLHQFQVPMVVDYMSLDVEGAEYEIMEHFPFDRYVIKIMTVERPSEKLKQLLQEKGYIFLKDLAWWGETLWAHTSSGFTPNHPKIVKIVTEEKR